MLQAIGSKKRPIVRYAIHWSEHIASLSFNRLEKSFITYVIFRLKILGVKTLATFVVPNETPNAKLAIFLCVGFV